MTDVSKGLDVSEELGKILKVDRRRCKDEKEKIKNSYHHLVRKVNENIKNGLLNINLDIYIQPEGVCEGIAYAIGCLNSLKRSQLRKFFNEIKSIEYDLKGVENNNDINKIKTKILTLIPKLAYSKGRNLVDENFYDFMKTLLMQVKKDMKENNPEEVFGIFVSILESILAYHTYHFPKEA